jgi:hypothetical protein
MNPLMERLMTYHSSKWGGYREKPGLGNQNAVLFLVSALWEIYLAGEDVTPGLKQWHEAMKATYLGGGRFSRKPDDDMLGSHDQYTGFAAGCLLWKVVLKSDSPWEKKLLSLGRKAWNYGGAKEAFPPWNLLKSQLKPNDIAFIKACCLGKTGGLGRKAMEINAKKSDSWNLHRLRGICLERISGGQPVADILKKRINYTKAITDYYGKGSVVAQAIVANGARW